MAFYNQFLTTTTRVNAIDWKTDVQDELLRDFLDKFPQFQENPYIKNGSRKYRFLLQLILKRKHWLLHQVMRANAVTKGRKNG